MRGVNIIRGAAGLVLAVVWTIGSTSNLVATQATPEAIPGNLAVPEGSVLLFAADARGVQIYDCAEDPEQAGAFAWIFRAPEADLLNANGDLIGTHDAGPSWEGNDGSKVVGEVLERAAAPDAGAIPWLLLAATSNEGSGVFSTVTHIQRLDTVGGVAPGTGCDEANAGDELRVDYTATYAFSYPAAD